MGRPRWARCTKATPRSSSSRAIWEVSTAWRNPRSAAAAVRVGYRSTVSNRFNRAAPPIWLRAGRSSAGACFVVFGGLEVGGCAGQAWRSTRDAVPLRPARHVRGGHALFGGQIGQGAAVDDVLGVEPVAVDLVVQSWLVTGVDSVLMREGGDCLAVSVVAGGDVAQRRSFLAVEGGELFRRQVWRPGPRGRVLSRVGRRWPGAESARDERPRVCC